MGSVVPRTAALAAVPAAVLFGTPGVAVAHGIGGGAQSVSDFVWSGFTHMVTGWDHLLFIAGVLLLARQVRRAATLITLFAAGHSTTLLIATLAGWRINATVVDIVIALSVVFVGVVGFLGQPRDWRWFAAAVTGFGLVHGLGLSTRLQDLGLPEEGTLARVIAFNVGVEIGQLLAIVAMFIVGDVVRHYLTWAQAPRAANAGLVVAGLVFASLLGLGAATGDGEPAEATMGSCQVRDRTEAYPAGGGHPPKDFYEPSETAPEKSFGHVIGDGYVIVQYPPSLPADQLTQLREFVTGPDGNRVVGGAKPDQSETLKAVHAYRTIVCDEFDLAALKQFKTTWFADPRSQPAE